MSGSPRAFGRYQLEGELGRGGMGVVFRARDANTGREVALKVLHGAGSRDPREIARLQREASLLARVEHPGIVRVLDAGAVDGIPYVALAYVRGRPLAGLTLPVRDHVVLLAKVARAIGDAHRASIVHRDLKPSNVLVEDGTGEPRVLDFGFALDARLDATKLSLTGEILGTPGYMAPETVDGVRGNDPRVDVYALGVMLYERLAGAHPFAAPERSIAEIVEAIREGAPSLEGRPGVDPTLAHLCARAMARDPRERPADGHALAAELEEWLVGRARAPRRRAWGLVLAGAVVVVASGGAIAWHLRPRGPEATVPAKAPPQAKAPTPPPAPAPALLVSAKSGLAVQAGEPAPESELVAINDAWNALQKRKPAPLDEVAALHARVKDVVRRYPGDVKARFLGALIGIRVPWEEHATRRELLRVLRMGKPIPPQEVDHIGRYCHALGFERGSASIGEALFSGPGGGVVDVRYGVYLVQLYLKAAPPVAWPERARELAERLLAKKTQANAAEYPDAAMLHVHRGDACQGLADSQGAAAAYEDAARWAASDAQRKELAAYADSLRQGYLKADPSRMGRLITLYYAPTTFLDRVKDQDAVADGGAEAEAASALRSLGDEAALTGHPEAAALGYLRAGRYLARAGDRRGARAVLERAEKLELPREAIDVRALVCRALARELLETPPDAARAEALAREAVAPAPDDVFDARATAELADGCALVARARLVLKDAIGARDALEKGRALSPLDARELDAVAARLAELEKSRKK